MKLRLLIVLSLVVVLAGFFSAENSYASGGSYQTCCANCCYATHIVKQGEYLKVIAARYGTTVDAILCCNNIRNPNLIYPGQRLTIPYPCGGTTKPPTGTWKGQWWNNRDLSGNPKLTRSYNSINFNWGSKAVGSGIGADNFSARFTSTQTFAAATYRFHVEVDDGVRLLIDDKIVIDQWRITSVAHYTFDKPMTAGKHKLQVDYFEHTGLARIKVWIERLSPSAGTVEYFSNRSLTPPAILTRADTKPIDYNWGDGPAVPGLPADNFSVRWVRNVSFEAGTYRFTVNVDDGVVVRIDGTPIIDEWHEASNATYVKDVQLTKGVHELRVRYFEAGGKAKIKVSWAKVPAPAPWKAKFFNNMNLAGTPAVTRNDTAINFNWGNKSPATGISADYFSAVWNGDFTFAEGTYRFTATADDGIRVWVDNTLIIDQWHLSSVRTYWADYHVSAGTHHVKVQYFENNGLAVAKLSWAKK